MSVCVIQQSLLTILFLCCLWHCVCVGNNWIPRRCSLQNHKFCSLHTENTFTHWKPSKDPATDWFLACNTHIINHIRMFSEHMCVLQVVQLCGMKMCSPTPKDGVEQTSRRRRRWRQEAEPAAAAVAYSWSLWRQCTNHIYIFIYKLYKLYV